MAKKFVKLGPKGASSFFDPSQPEPVNQRLLPGQIKEFEETALTLQAIEARGLTVVDGDELKAYQNKQEDLAKEQANRPSPENMEAANTAVMQKAQELDTKEGDLNTKQTELEQREAALAEREKNVEAQEAKLGSAPNTNADDTTGAGTATGNATSGRNAGAGAGTKPNQA